jgi:uncharacterized protein involved in type VI secretion and phage assembly
MKFTNYKETFITFVNKDGVKLGITISFQFLNDKHVYCIISSFV